ncbi:AMP-binding protein [Steroidobacter agaridevorans]|uniref:AMP-binding protein n=1 Tax=Steroidobacter agaridevorans TaxID=2695856 RepID=A0A829YG09_9GAMM|nr:phenylacetate--CoA ligase family protein [Steroidobacter agaridevorans]GFE82194.1 AMP-binding protein [Steroidobacter agaridevorans]
MNHRAEQRFHKNLYYTLQSLRGRHVGPFVRRLQSWEQLDRASFEHLTRMLLSDALRYARSQVPLYSSGAWQSSLSRASADELSAWPVLERKMLITHREQLQTRRFALGVFPRHSSGSTGEVVTVRYNPHAGGWSWAQEYRSMHWFGIPTGSRTLLLWGGGHPLLDWVRNCRVFSTKNLTFDQLERATNYLLEQRPMLCMGLPSAIAQLARHVRAHRPQAPAQLVPFVKLGGEQVYPFQRDEIAQHFGARVFESYGSTEMGPIAHECPAGSRHVMADHVHLEIFNGDEPARPGEFGDLVLTSLFNRAMPLVRCRIGDRGRLSPDPCPCGLPHPVLSELVGRAADMFVTADGKLVHGSEIGRRLQLFLSQAPLGSVAQVLFQQKNASHWNVLVESAAGFNDELAAQLRQIVHSTFGESCRVDIERVTLVPREKSGKYRYYRRLPESAH